MLPLNNDQRRESVNTRQRFDALKQAKAHLEHYRGSLIWSSTKGIDYLLRSEKASPGALRRQKSLGRRSPETERIKADFDQGRAEAQNRYAALQEVMQRQASVNRVLGLGRVPRLGARIIRALDDHGLLDSSLRIIGTHALFAYEAAAGVTFESALTATEDIDLLFDARASLRLALAVTPELSLLRLLQKIDHSFVRSKQEFRAINSEGYFVDLVAPLRNPPWTKTRERIGDEQDLSAVMIDGLQWLESSPSFEAVAIDERGDALRMVVLDPRAFAAHKWWLAHQPSRDPLKKKRDADQATAVARLCLAHFPHLPYAPDDLKMLPHDVFAAAAHLFVPSETTP